MLAIVATVVFAVATIEQSVGELSLVPLGLALLALHHASGGWSPWRR